MSRRRDFEDDGRTIADMREVSGLRRDDRPRQESSEGPQQPPFTRKEQFFLAMAALKAAMLIALAFIVGLGLVVLLFGLL
jgi:hypothetical protein